MKSKFRKTLTNFYDLKTLLHVIRHGRDKSTRRGAKETKDKNRATLARSGQQRGRERSDKLNCVSH